MKNQFPDWIVPMAATLTQERFTGSEWSFERKVDGIRLLAYKKGKQVKLFSRNRLPQNLPAISKAIAKLPHRELILDGEIDWHGVVTHASSRAGYHIFDIMWMDGHETMSLPLEERRALLRQLPLTPPLRRVVELKVPAPDFSSPSGRCRVRVRSVATGSSGNVGTPWDLARDKGWEGVIAKRRGSVYEQRRSRNWLKMKCELAQEFVVGGFTDPQGKRVGLGALLVGYYEHADSSVPGAVATGSEPNLCSPSAKGRVRVRSLATESSNNSISDDAERKRGRSVTSEGDSRPAQPDFIFAGKIGTGFNNELLLELRRKLDALEIPKPPFTKAVGLPRLRAHWVQPKIVVQVGFIQWTGHGKLRHPRLLGVRTDKNPPDVVRE